MSLEGFYAALGVLLNALFVLAAVYVYVSLARQITARPAEVGLPGTRQFGSPEAVLAFLLTGLLLGSAILVYQRGALPEPTMAPNPLEGMLYSIGLLALLLGFVRLRGFDLASLAGLGKLRFGRTLSTGTILLLAAYPLVGLADMLTRWLGGESSRQEIVELFNSSSTMPERVGIIVLAVAVAPMVEEFLFRFFLYGVMRRYAGRWIGIVGNALLFAAVHGHRPSLGPLFVLGLCLTIAYEWSGSILVSMMMHALFNSATLIFLAFPQ